MESLWRPFSFSQRCPRPALFSHQQHWWSLKLVQNLELTAQHSTTPAWPHVNHHGQHPFFPEESPFTIVDSACPEALGKFMQNQKKSHFHDYWVYGYILFLYVWRSIFMRNPIEVRRRLGVGWAESPLWWLASWNIEWKFNLLLTFCNLLGDTSLGEGRGILRGRKVYRHTTRNAHTQELTEQTNFFHIWRKKLKIVQNKHSW